jgi:hypothetical protein
MLAVTMRTLRLFLVGNLCLAGACGGSAPVHTGYPEGDSAPWEKASSLRLNDNLEAMSEGELSFPNRHRARWYAVDLPAPGKITARVSTESTVKGADIAMEILDAGFNVNAEGQNDDDIGQPKKVREYKDARQGKSYIHIYTIGRDDVVAYTLRVRFEPKPQTARIEPVTSPSGPDKTQFPWTVPNLPVLPQVGKGGGGGTVAKETPPPPPDPNAGFTVIKATIIEFNSAGSGVRVILNKGQNQNLADGLEGDVLSGGKPLKGGHFKIKSCHADDCEAVAPSATMDQIQANRSVVVKIPK